MTNRLPPDDHRPPPTARLGHGSARRVQVELVAIAGVAALVVALGLGLGTPAPDPTSSPDGSLASGSAGPSSTTRPSPSGPCSAVDAADPPEVRLWSTSDDRNPLPGVPAPGPADPSFGTWPVPPLVGAIWLPDRDSSLVVLASRGGCLASVSADVASADAEEPAAAAVALGLDLDGLPDDELDLGWIPEGDWVLRVTATFSVMGGAVIYTAPMTTFFRVVSGPITELVPSPEITPAVPCSTGDSGELGLELSVGERPPYRWPELDPAGIQVSLGEPLELRTVGDQCARTWSIAVIDMRGNSFLQDAYPNPADNPFEATQNRWRVTQLLIGETILQASVRFGRGRTIDATWRLQVSTPPMPTVLAFGPDGRTSGFLHGCGQFWNLGDVGAAIEACDVQTIPDDLPVLEVADGDVVRLAPDDGAIVEWFARCGEAVAGPGGQPIFVTVDECNLGEGFEGAAAAFLPWPGDRLILAGLTLERDGVTIYGNYFGRIVVVP